MLRKLGLRYQHKVIPLFRDLPTAQQNEIFSDTVSVNGTRIRKIIVATPIAETSITVDNLTSVIDCGYHKQTTFDSVKGIYRFLLTPVTQTNCVQRWGRIGRLEEGHVFCMYTQETYNRLDRYPNPPIILGNVSDAYLRLLGMVRDINQVPRVPALMGEFLNDYQCFSSMC